MTYNITFLKGKTRFRMKRDTLPTGRHGENVFCDGDGDGDVFGDGEQVPETAGCWLFNFYFSEARMMSGLAYELLILR